MGDIVQKLMDESNHHSGELAELLEGAASEIDCLLDEKADLSSRLESAVAETESIRNVLKNLMEQVLKQMRSR